MGTHKSTNAMTKKITDETVGFTVQHHTYCEANATWPVADGNMWKNWPFADCNTYRNWPVAGGLEHVGNSHDCQT